MKKTVLISYQDDREVDLLSDFLLGMDYRVETSRTIAEMLQMVKNISIQVLLLGDEMEGVKAWNIIAVVKEIAPKVQVIMISSEGSLDWVRRLREAGIFYQAMKPVDPKEIKSAVACAFEKIERESFNQGSISFFIPRTVSA